MFRVNFTDSGNRLVHAFVQNFDNILLNGSHYLTTILILTTAIGSTI